MTQRAKRRHRSRWLLATAMLPALLPFTTGTPARGDAAFSWLDTVNVYRASAGLMPVVENPAWTAPVASHARYVALSRDASHDEDRSSPYYSPEGAAAARRSLITGVWGAQVADRELVESLVAAPFHLSQLLQPGLRQVAMGIFQEDTPPLASAAVLDVFQGVDPTVQAAVPIVFPGDGSTVPLTAFRGETPDPLSACPGYVAPAGLPVVALLPTPPVSVRTSITLDGQPIEHCAITAGSYTSPNPSAAALVKALLTQKNGVVLVPRAPLTVGATYRVSITSGTQQISWMFTTAPTGTAPTPTRLLPLTPKSTAKKVVTAAPRTRAAKASTKRAAAPRTPKAGPTKA